MIKYEPLKNKEFPVPFFDSAFKKTDVKSAVQGLLQEIKAKKDGYKEVKEVISGLCIAEELIKKWFADVVENES